MSYDLYIGDRSFSSWSLRGWLMLEKFDLPFRTHLCSLFDGSYKQDLATLAPARLLPTLKTPEGTIIGETMAIAEELNSRHPDAQMWPADPAARAYARWISAEMHAGFIPLRSECPMQLLFQYKDFAVSDDVQRDLDRLETLLGKARREFGAAGPWLFGAYSIADAFFAPIAARIAGHDLPVSDLLQDYVTTTLNDLSFRQWRALGLTRNYETIPYAMDLETQTWPGPTPLAARPCEGPSVNATCPYSGDPVTDFLEIGGTIYGFCNPQCRDKTVNDPEAWPAFVSLTQS